MIMNNELMQRLVSGNRNFIQNGNAELRVQTAEHGQHPYAIVIACSDSRVIPEEIFSAGIGELFVIRVAGNVLDNHQLGSIEYAAAHLGCKMVVLLGHTGCGAVSAALSGHHDGFITYIVEDVLEAIGEEKDPDAACKLNVRHGVERIRTEFADHPEVSDVEIIGAVYDITSGEVEWLS